MVDRGAYKQQTFIHHSSGGWKSEILAGPDLASSEGASWFIDGDSSLCPRLEEGARELPGVSFRRTLIPSTGAAPS